MFRRDAFVLIAVALIGIVFTIYMVMSSTPFFPKSLQSERGECPANNLYYPAEPGAVMDQFRADWYSSELIPLGERPIFQDKNQDQLAVRFTLISSSRAGRMVRTVETGDGRTRLVGKWMSGGYGGCDTTKISCSVDRILTDSERARLAAAGAHLFRVPSYGCPTGVDGSMWLMEASGRGQYRFWADWSPVRGDLMGLALVMLALTGWPSELDTTLASPANHP